MANEETVSKEQWYADVLEDILVPFIKAAIQDSKHWRNSYRRVEIFLV